MIKILSLFSGIGAFEKALKNINQEFEIVKYCEIDKYASKAYSLLHGIDEINNLLDVTKVDTSTLPPNIDMITYGFPCTDISLAGKQAGFKDKNGNLTRSGLFFEGLRIIQEVKPKFAICENVKNLTGKKFKKEFEIILSSLEKAGYNNYYKVLNAKDYGVPQNRERIFIISIRKDIDKGYEFPDGFSTNKKLKDVLEEKVDEKYYLSDDKLKSLLLFNNSDLEKVIKPGNVKPSDKGQKVLVYSEYEVKQIGNWCPGTNRANPNQGRIYDTEGISPALTTMSGGNRQPFIPVREATKKGYAEAYEYDSINFEQPNSKTRRGRVGKQVSQTLTTSPQITVVEPVICASRGRNPDNPNDRTTGSPTVQRLEVNSRGISNTITTVQKDNYVLEPYPMRIRKLTPKECFRLMGFDDEDVDLLSANKISNSQLYKMAGNSIVVDVLMYIFFNLREKYKEYF